MYMETHTHTHMYLETHTQWTHTLTHMYLQTHTHTHVHADTHSHACTRRHTHTRDDFGSVDKVFGRVDNVPLAVVFLVHFCSKNKNTVSLSVSKHSFSLALLPLSP